MKYYSWCNKHLWWYFVTYRLMWVTALWAYIRFMNHVLSLKLGVTRYGPVIIICTYIKQQLRDHDNLIAHLYSWFHSIVSPFTPKVIFLIIYAEKINGSYAAVPFLGMGSPFKKCWNSMSACLGRWRGTSCPAPRTVTKVSPLYTLLHPPTCSKQSHKEQHKHQVKDIW